MAQTTEAKKAGKWLNLCEPERLVAIRKVFDDRKVPNLSSSAMMRIVMDEWIAKQKLKTAG